VKGPTKAARTSIPKLLREARNDRVGDAPAPRVSVVIPTYNRAALVTRAIESVLAQTYGDLELIVVDDASSDTTPDAVVRFDDRRLRYVLLPKNGGQWHAENVGIARARGEWVAFLDDDDEYVPDKLEQQLARAERAADPRVSVVYCRPQAIDKDGPRQPVDKPTPEGDVTKYLLTATLWVTPTLYMAKRSALIDAGGFDESLAGAQDWDLWLRLSMAGHHFVALRDRLAIYHRDHDERQTNDSIRTIRSTFVLERRWGALMRDAMGPEPYETWAARRDKRSRKAIDKLVREIERAGSRSEAWRYVSRMAPVLPWGARFFARALAVVAFGRLPHRISRVRQGKAGAPWLRRLFGAG